MTEPEASDVDARQGDDRDLWSTDDRVRPTVDGRLLLSVVGLVAFIVLGLVVVGGSGGTDDAAPAASSSETQVPAEATPQLTSQQAPWGASELTPTTLPPGAVPHGCAEWDGAFNYPGLAMTDGVYLWSSFDGWHLRLAGTKIRELTGAVTGAGVPPLLGTTSGDVEVREDEKRSRLAFTLRPGRQPVGFDFAAGCDEQELTFELTAGGAPLPVAQVHLGQRGVVKEYPLVARRTLPLPE